MIDTECSLTVPLPGRLFLTTADHVPPAPLRHEWDTYPRCRSMGGCWFAPDSRTIKVQVRIGIGEPWGTTTTLPTQVNPLAALRPLVENRGACTCSRSDCRGDGRLLNRRAVGWGI